MLPAELREVLVRAAIQAKEQAYFCHSSFRVGAALMSTDGTIAKGTSVDNASYGEYLRAMFHFARSRRASTCAERTAIVTAISEGKRTFSALAVASDVVTPISPCGLCRQVIHEFCHDDMPVLLVPGNYPRKTDIGQVLDGGGVIEVPFGKLLPPSLGPQDIGRGERV